MTRNRHNPNHFPDRPRAVFLFSRGGCNRNRNTPYDAIPSVLLTRHRKTHGAIEGRGEGVEPPLPEKEMSGCLLPKQHHVVQSAHLGKKSLPLRKST